ncbi:MAG TPA: polyprenyl synthetase family protein [Pseudonocardiaceae bacterium]
MRVSPRLHGPYPFGRRDLEAERLDAGVRHTLAHFRQWRDENPRAIAAHAEQYTAQLDVIAAEGPAAFDRRPWTPRRRRERRRRLAREVVHFGVLNMGEVPDDAMVDAMLDGAAHTLPLLGRVRGDGTAAAVPAAIAALRGSVPLLGEVPGADWLTERLTALYAGLPDAVVRAGSMGKVVRAMAGVLVIGAYGVPHATEAARRDHLAGILPGAYAFGAAYAIVDDTLHDLAATHLGRDARERHHRLIAAALATGEPTAEADVPDHPLAEELHLLHRLLLADHPFDRRRHLWHAAEAMYQAQHRDASRTAGAADDLYPDVFVKAGMSRVVANVLAGRRLGDAFYERCVNTILVSQLRDDLIDRREDRRAGRITPFTAGGDLNPVHDLFAYNAYVAEEVYGGDPVVADALTYYGAARLAAHLSVHGAGDLLRDHPATGEITRFLRAAAGLPPRTVRRLGTVDQVLRDRAAGALTHRPAAAVDCRTFVADRLSYIDDVLRRLCTPDEATGDLEEIVRYALGGTGKRLRPAMCLMLADSLGIDPVAVEPVVAAGELFHTASLLFDDLPAHDDATVRRGRPAAHLVFDESAVQLAGLSMISSAFGLLAGLSDRFPAERVTEVVGYAGGVLGPQRLCRGQHLDLRMSRPGAPAATREEILHMYDLKTSTAIEAALVPLMMVLGRPRTEIGLLERYAHHAGIVFQIRDDVLDATSSTEVLGKNSGNDTGKVNLVRSYGPAAAEELMRSNLAAAVECCRGLPFDTRLLECTVRHFALRRR